LADLSLGESKPCCMCINLMRTYGIKKVYYSDSMGNLCCQTIEHLFESCAHLPHGLKLMIQSNTSTSKVPSYHHLKLPLTKDQKRLLLLIPI
jgi:tRNA(Arg) A34 adenosine deaminase TadA